MGILKRLMAITFGRGKRQITNLNSLESNDKELHLDSFYNTNPDPNNKLARQSDLTNHSPQSAELNIVNELSVKKLASTVDVRFYKSYYTDMTELSDFEAIQHYITTGFRDDRCSNLKVFIDRLEKEFGPLPDGFSLEGYTNANPELIHYLNEEWQAVEHYLRYGKAEGRSYSTDTKQNSKIKDLDVKFYKSYYTDLSQMTDENAIKHYKQFGIYERRFPNGKFHMAAIENATKKLPLDFSVKDYLSANSDLQRHLKNDWQAVEHFLRYGRMEGRKYKSEQYDIESLNRITLNAYSMPEVVIDPKRKPTINVLVPAFDFGSMSAGFFGVFQIAQFIRSCGFNVRLVMYDRFEFNEDEARKKLKNYPGMEDLFDVLEVIYVGDRVSPLKISPYDNCVATVWYSAYFAKKIMQATGGGKFLYLIQDYESPFHPSGALWTMAENTYSFNYSALFSTESLEKFFIQKAIGVFASKGTEHIHFNNACSSVLLNRSEFILRSRKRPRRRLAFYSRPVVERNMFPLGALALCQAVKQKVFNLDEWEFVGIGLGLAKIQLSDDVCMEQMPRMNLKEYQEIISTFDVGLCLMASPHPSLLPFDLAGSGAVVVTNSFSVKDQAYFDSLTRGVIVAEPNVDALVEALRTAVEQSDNYEQRYENAKAMRFPQSWLETFDDRHVTFINSVFASTNK